MGNLGIAAFAVNSSPLISVEPTALQHCQRQRKRICGVRNTSLHSVKRISKTKVSDHAPAAT